MKRIELIEPKYRKECAGCLNKVSIGELVKDGYCLTCREQDNANYQPSDPEERHNFNKWKNENKEPKKDDDYYAKLVASEYGVPELGDYKTIGSTKWVKCVECKEKWNSEYTVCSEKTNGKIICKPCLNEIEKKQEQLETKIEILPKK